MSDSTIYSGSLNRDATVPTKVIEKGLLSGTSEALDCYAHQRFSQKLQAFMVSYVMSVSSEYSVFVRD